MLPPPPPREPTIDLEAIAADAFAAGVATGVAQSDAALLPERTALRAAAAALTAATVVDIECVRPVFLTLVRTLAETVVAGELRVNPDVVSRLVDAALASVLMRDDLVIRLHPDDVDRVGPDLAVVADPTLLRGEVSIDGPAFILRDGFGARLAALAEALL